MGKWDVEVLVVLVRVKSKGFKACSGVLHGGGVVATDGRSGTVVCARGDTGEGLVRWEGPQATRGHAQELEVVLGKLCRRWAAATEAEQKRSSGAREGRRQTGVRRTRL
jgi:hypothetical protein